MKIYEIAEKCGYQNTAYFIKIFKSHFNMTPQEYFEKTGELTQEEIYQIKRGYKFKPKFILFESLSS